MIEKRENDLNIPIKPPTIYFLSIIAGFLIQWMLPIKILPTFTIVIGLLFIPTALILLVWGSRLFAQAETAVNPDILPSTLVTTGIYKYTRNPMYLGFTSLQIGFAFALNNVWLFITLLPTLTYMTYKVIHKEETFLEAAFGQAYLDYKTNTRRWL